VKLILRDSEQIEDPIARVDHYLRTDTYGPSYYRHQPSTDHDSVVLEDLAAAVLLVGQPRPRAALTLAASQPVDVASIPTTPLHTLDPRDRAAVVDGIMLLIELGTGFQSALATKVLHKKRPDSVPVLDNQAIFGTYQRAGWNPGDWPKYSDSVRDRSLIERALEAIHHDLSRSDNQATWEKLATHFQSEGFSRIELFDMIWWDYAYSSRLSS
jgi:hypothetical protein